MTKRQDKDTLRILVLAGGGLAGAWQAGALRRIVDDDPGCDWDSIVGVSVGAIAAAFIGQADREPITEDATMAAWIGQYHSWWAEMRSSEDFIKRRRCFILKALMNKSIMDNRPLYDALKRSVDVRLIANSKRYVRVGAVCLEDGRFETFGPTTKYGQASERFIDAVVASASIPILFDPIKIGNTHWVDGGLRNSTPFHEALMLMASRGKNLEVDIVQCIAAGLPIVPSGRVDSTMERAVRTAAIVNHERMASDMDIPIDVVKKRIGVDKMIKVNVYRPRSQPMENLFKASGDEIRKALAQGYDEARAPGRIEEH